MQVKYLGISSNPGSLSIWADVGYIQPLKFQNQNQTFNETPKNIL